MLSKNFVYLNTEKLQGISGARIACRDTTIHRDRKYEVCAPGGLAVKNFESKHFVPFGRGLILFDFGL